MRSLKDRQVNPNNKKSQVDRIRLSRMYYEML